MAKTPDKLELKCRPTIAAKPCWMPFKLQLCRGQFSHKETL